MCTPVAEEARLIAEQEEKERLEREQQEEEERQRLELKVSSHLVKFHLYKTAKLHIASYCRSESMAVKNCIKVLICNRTESAEGMS